MRPLDGSSAAAAYDDDERPGTGIALKTLRQRLTHVYGRHARLTLDPTERGMIATVRVPEHTVQIAQGAP